MLTTVLIVGLEQAATILEQSEENRTDNLSALTANGFLSSLLTLFLGIMQSTI